MNETGAHDLDLVITRRARDLGGFTVGRVLPFAHRQMVGPFIFFDHLGPVAFAAGIPRSVDVRPHPHIGLSTVTYLFEGEIMHRDSLGTAQAIRPGEINWMTAGRGITHSERFERARIEGGKIDAIQVWIALPKEREEMDPSFSHHPVTELPAFDSPLVRGRLLAGNAFGLKAPVPVQSPLFYMHAELAPGAWFELPNEHSERAVYVADGIVEFAGHTYEAGNMLVFAARKAAAIHATSRASLIALGGEPVGPRFIEWNFVASSEERIQQARADWRAGRMKLPDHDNQEFIPLPDEPTAQPNALS
jgi:redox-sensitive bicupin YhaK (pirin superfamily)